MLAKHEPAVFLMPEGKLHFIAIKPGGIRAENRLNRHVFESGDMLKRLRHLLFFECQLILIAQLLPFAAAAASEILAARRDAQR